MRGERASERDMKLLDLGCDRWREIYHAADKAVGLRGRLSQSGMVCSSGME